MIAAHGTTTPKEAARQFAEWAACFREGVFMMLQVFFDETAKSKGGKDEFIAIGGCVALKDDWVGVQNGWQAVLKKYDVKSFHFREFNAKASKTNPESNYYQWDDQRREDFFYDLAMVMSRTIVPVGGDYPVKKHREICLDGDPIKNVFAAFFNDVREAVSDYWPELSGNEGHEKILFVYDMGAGDKWNKPLHEAHRFFKERDERFGTLAFDDDKSCPPLQMADFFCGIYRQVSERRTASGQWQQYRIVDIILFRHLRSPEHDLGLANMSESKFKILIANLREDEKRQKREWKRRGISGKIYYPSQYHPQLANRKTI
jgi:hypothetical protein